MAEALGSVLLAAYSFAGRALIPFVPAILNRRARRGLEDRLRRGERYGIASGAPPQQNVIWVHAASVGETNAVLPLIARLSEAGWFVVLTTITVTGATTAARNSPAGVLHQFAPVDIKPWVARFIDHWRPHAALFVESEVWPVITDQLARRGIPHIIVNAQMSDVSFRRWRLLGPATRRVFGRIALALVQSEADAKRLSRLGVTKTKAVGNLKFDVPPPAADTDDLAALRQDIGDCPIWLAASTHPGEEEIVAEVHRSLAERFPGLITIVVPRHPNRGTKITEALNRAGVALQLRSKGPAILPGGGILIADTLGELGLFYRLAEIAFIGGSLVAQGGHNPIEPVGLATAVLHGPHVENFASIYAALQAANASLLVTNVDELGDAVAGLLDGSRNMLELTKRADKALAPFPGALERTLAELQPYLAVGPDLAS